MRARIWVVFGVGALVAAGVGLPSGAAAGPARAECWQGQWSESGPPGEQRFHFRLRLVTRGEANVSGEFTWRQEHVSWEPQGDGEIGQEFVQGTRTGSRITLRGVRVSPGSDLALDAYRIELLPDGRITGQSASPENDWTARIVGQHVPCPAPLPTPTPRAPTPG